MKIIIVGGGIGGLAAYHALRKYLTDLDTPLTIQILESYRPQPGTQATIGGGIGIAPNGLRALAAVAPEALALVEAKGCHAATFAFRNSRGTLLGRYRNGRAERYGYGQVLLTRETVHQGLLIGVPEEAISWGRRVAAVRETEGGVEVELTDGSTETADLVIGADGVRSAVRTAVVGPGYEAKYDGFTGVGGFVPTAALPAALQHSLHADPATMTFGAQGFFGYALAGPIAPSGALPDQIMWWSTYEVSPPPPRGLPVAAVAAQLLARHGAWRSPFDAPGAPLFRSIIGAACGAGAAESGEDAAARGVLFLPRYYAVRLPRWCTPAGRVALLGDAAHAMPPDGGQGVSTAVEDAIALALVLRHHLARAPVREALPRAAAGYEAVRLARVRVVMEQARRRGDNKKRRTWWEEWIRDWVMWLLCKLPESINDRMFKYDVEAEVQRYLATLTD